MVLRLEGNTYMEIISEKSAVRKQCSDMRQEVQRRPRNVHIFIGKGHPRTDYEGPEGE
jgi:hypothetical protein